MSNERALITGANRGIGLALAREFLDHGMHVVATARDPDSAMDLDHLASSAPSLFTIVQLDLLDPESIGSAARQVASLRGSLDILVNNAAIFPEEGHEKFEDLDLRQFTEAFETNVAGTARVTRAFLPLLRNSTNPRIVNISSGAGSIADKTDSNYYCYSTSKAALNMLTRALAAEFRGRIIVTAISPGWVRTAMGGDNAEITPAESAHALYSTIARLTPDDSGQFLNRAGSRTEYTW